MPKSQIPNPKSPLIIGLTGSIGMGKSTAAKILARLGLPFYSADAAVHALLGPKGRAVSKVAKLFPSARRGDAIDRKILGALVFGQPALRRQLEAILHPMVRQEEKKFLAQARKTKAPAVVLEIPLLFETGAEQRCDVVLCVTAPKAIQQARVLKRRGMTPEKFRAILKAQLPDAEKRRRADYVIKTGKGLADTRKQLMFVIENLITTTKVRST